MVVKATDPKHVVGIATGSMIARGWLMALILVSSPCLPPVDHGYGAASIMSGAGSR